MIIDIGGGTADIAVISLGGIVKSKSLKIAGDRLNADIISYVRGELKSLLATNCRERKNRSRPVMPESGTLESAIPRRDLVTPPSRSDSTDADMREAMAQRSRPYRIYKEVLERLSGNPFRYHVLASISWVVARSSRPRSAFAESLKIPVHIAGRASTAVRAATGIISQTWRRIKTY